MKHISIAACILGLFLGFAGGCATTPSAPITSPEVTVNLVPERYLARYAVPFTNDPFYAPNTLLMSRNEFVTMAVTIALPEAARVVINGDVRDSDGTSIARLYTKEELRDYWLARGREADPDMVKRLEYLDRFYVPKLDFTERKGRFEYYVVMVGKLPLPRPAKAILSVALGGNDPQQFEFDLPPSKK